MSRENYWVVRAKELAQVLSVRAHSLMDEAEKIREVLGNDWFGSMEEEGAAEVYREMKKFLADDDRCSQLALDLLRQVEELKSEQRKRVGCGHGSVEAHVGGGCRCREHELEAQLEGARGRAIQEAQAFRDAVSAPKSQMNLSVWHGFFRDALEAGMASEVAMTKESLVSTCVNIADLALAAYLERIRTL